MKTVTLTLSGVLLATSALMAPGFAYAQTPPAPSQALPSQDPVAEDEPEAAGELDEVIVLGPFIPEPNRERAEVAAFLTSEDLERTGDSSAAGALARVTGLTVVEGRFVYVRGLGERYSSALLNGSPLPSPEPLQRVVPLDLFPRRAGALVSGPRRLPRFGPRPVDGQAQAGRRASDAEAQYRGCGFLNRSVRSRAFQAAHRAVGFSRPAV